MDKKKEIFDFLNGQVHAVIATVSEDNKPEGAFIGFGQTEDLEIIFGTGSGTRKAKNIAQNPNVAFTISTEATTVQYEGVAERIEGEEATRLKELFWQKVPSARKFDSNPDQTYFKVTPRWIRITDFTKEPEEISEVNL